MRRFLAYIACTVTLMLSAGCNPDVFVERLEASQAEYALTMLGGRVEVEMNHGDWMLERVSVNRVDVYGKVTEGGTVKENAPFCLKDYGRAEYSSSYIDFTLERNDDRHIMLDVGNSLSVKETVISLHLADGYEDVEISVYVAPCGGYVFDRIEYGDITYISSEDMVEEGWRFTFDNVSDGPVVRKFPVFGENAVRTVVFPAYTIGSDDIPHAEWYDELMGYVGVPFEVPIPDAFLEDGNLVFSGQTVTFGVRDITLPLELPDAEVDAVFQPGRSTLVVYWGYEEYAVDYTVWLRHNGGGRPLSFSGTFTSKAYTGEWVKIYGK